MTVTLQQLQYRFRSDTLAVNTAAVFPVALNTTWNPGASAFRIRFTIQNTGTTSAATQLYQLEVSRNAGAYGVIGGTTGVLPSSIASVSADNAALTSAQLPVGSGTFLNGQYDSSGATSTFVMTTLFYTEVEFGIVLDFGHLTTGDTLDFRVYGSSTGAFTTYTQTPRITVGNYNQPTVSDLMEYELPLGHAALRRFPNDLRTYVDRNETLLDSPPVVYIPSRVGQWGVPAELMPPARVRGYGRAPQQAASLVVPSPVPHVDWQLPIAPFRVMQTWIQSPLMPQVDVTKMPGRVVEWGMWLDPRVAMTWIQSPEFALPVVPKPVTVDLSIPLVPPRMMQTWLRGPFAGTPVPLNQYDWPLPKIAVQPIRTWLQAPFVGTPPPVNQYSWPLPIQNIRAALTWTQSPQLQPVSTAKPVNQSDWPLPIRAIRAALTWTQSPMFATPVVVTPPAFMPGRVVDWGMSWEIQRRALTYVRGVAGVDMAMPVNQADWPLPVRTVERARTWTQAPMFAAPVAPIIFIPSRVTNWGVAELRSTIFVPAEIQNTTALHATPPPPKPINQYDWPVPIAAARLAGGYGFAFARNTKDMSPVNMPPRIGVFSPPIGYYYPNSLRWFASFPFQGVGPSAASSGMVHNIPFIATMGGMTAR